MLLAVEDFVTTHKNGIMKLTLTHTLVQLSIFVGSATHFQENQSLKARLVNIFSIPQLRNV